MKHLTTILLTLVSAFTLQAQISQNVTLIGHWQDSSLNVFFGNQYNECWGFVQGGREYAAVGTTEGYSIIDLSDPANPTEVDRIDGETDQAIHRDMHDHDGYLYMVCDEGDSRLKIADLSYLPDSVHLVYDSGEHFSRAHNIFIDSTSGLMYGFSLKDTAFNSYQTVMIYEFDPVTETVVEVGGYDAGSQFVTSHDGYVVNDTGYINMSGDGFYMIDFRDRQNPTVIGQLPVYPTLVYNHSGWLDPVRKLYMMADEWQGTPINILDVSDPSNINIVNSFLPGTNSDIIPHNLMINGRFMFLSAYTDGLRIFDLIDPHNPVLKGFYDTYPGADTDIYEGAWGIYSLLPSGLILLSDQKTGLYIFDVSPALARDNGMELHAEVWPVPSQDKVRLDWSPEDMQATGFRLLSIEGQVLQHRELEPYGDTELEVNLEALKSGVYLLELEGVNGERIVERVVKQ